MGPRPTTPVNSPCSFDYTCVPSVPIREPSTPLCVSVGVSPIHGQVMPPWTLVSRGLSPVPLEELLPPDIAAFFSSLSDTEGRTQDLMAYSLQCPEVILVTESDSKDEVPLSRARTQPQSPEIVPETQVEGDEELLVHLFYILSCIYSLIQGFQMAMKLERSSVLKCRKLHMS